MRPPTNDHDLLIRLDTRFDTFEKNHTTLWTSLNETVHRFISELQNKVDKEEFKALRMLVSDHDNILKADAVQKKTAIQIGNLGVKFWGGLMAFVLFLLTIYKAFH